MLGKAKILQLYACMHLNLACSVKWELLYCIVELLLSVLYVALMLHDWNSLLCAGLWKALLEMGCFVPPWLFSLTSVYGPKPGLFYIIFDTLFAYFLTTRMSIYVKWLTKDHLTHRAWFQPVLDGCTEHPGEEQVSSVLRSRFSSEGSFLKFLTCLIILGKSFCWGCSIGLKAWDHAWDWAG